MERGLLAAGIGVEVAAHRLDLLGDLRGRCAWSVPLNAMCSSMWETPISGWLFVAAAGVDPDAQSGAFQLAIGSRDNRQAIGKFDISMVMAPV